MSAQDVIKKFMASLANHGYSNSDKVGQNILDGAIRASSRYSSASEAIEAMEADQVKAEKAAVLEVLGSKYAGMTIDDIDPTILAASAKDYSADGFNKSKGNAFFDGYSPNADVTVKDLLEERKSYIFLETYCGVELETRYWISNGGRTTYNDSMKAADGTQLNSTGNTDTGAITGLDAGGSSTAKTAESVVPESLANTYKAADGASAQTIITDSRNWVIQATDEADTITSNAADSINAGAGNDQITANASGATITSGTGNDKITVSDGVNDITLSDLNSSDTVIIGGTFNPGSAQIEDGLLVVTDKIGTRKIRFDNYATAYNAKVGSTTLKKWLTNADIDLDNLTSTSYGNDSSASSGNVVGEEDGRIALSPDDHTSEGTPDPNPHPLANGIVTSYSDKNTSNSSDTESASLTVNGVNVDASTTGEVKSGDTVLGTTSSEFPNASTFTRNGLTLHLLGTSDKDDPNNITAVTFDKLGNDEKTIVASLFKWWAGEALTLNEESYDLGFTSPTASVKDIGLFFYTADTGTLAAVWHTPRSSDGEAYKLYLSVNMKFYSDILETDENGTSNSENAGYLDRTLAHEFTHAVMAANINYFSTLPQFIKEGSAELTHGIDDERRNVIFELGRTDASLAAALSLDNTSTGQEICYAGGYMFLRYLAKQAANQTAFGDITATVNVDGSKDGIYYITGNDTNEVAQFATELPENAIQLGTVKDGVYTVNDTGVHQVISGVSKVESLTVNDTFKGSDGADTVTTAQGSNVATGGGNDSINVYGQFSTINAGAGDDTVNLIDGSHHSINLGDGDNLINVTTSDSYKNTITGGSGNDSVIDASGEHYEQNHVIDLGDGNNVVSFYYGANLSITTGTGSDTISVGGGKNNTVSTGAGNDTIENKGNNHLVDAGADNDSIRVSGSNNTIIGGAGDDDILQTSDKGNIYLYTSGNFGNDTIKQFMTNDTIRIADEFTTEISKPGTLSYGDSGNGQYLTITVKSGSDTVGTIRVQTYPGVTFDAATHIVQKTPEADVIEGLTYNDEGKYYEIASAADLKTLADYVSAGNDCDGLTFKITANINMQDAEDFTSIGTSEIPFKGTLEGDDKTISNLNIDLFAHVDAATLQNIQLNNSTGALVTAGNVNVINEINNLIIKTADGDDTITNTGNNVTIDGGEGNDLVNLRGNNASVDTSNGDDTIVVTAGVSVVSLGGFSVGDEIQLPETVSYLDSTADEIIAGNLTIKGTEYSWETTPWTGIWTFDEKTGVAKYGGGHASGIYLDGDNKIAYRNIAITGDVTVEFGGISKFDGLDNYHHSGVELAPQNFSDDGVTLNVNDGSQWINLMEGDYNNKSFTGSANDDGITNTINARNILINTGEGDDTVYNYGTSTTIYGGAGNDFLENTNGDNVSINGGLGNNKIDLYRGTGLTVNTGEGNDTIRFYDNYDGDGVELTVENFGLSDVINFGAPEHDTLAISDFSVVDGKIVATADKQTATISGLTISEETDGWKFTDTKATHGNAYTAGAYLKDGKEIVYREESFDSDLELGGISGNIALDGKIVKINAENFSLDTANILSNTGGYSFVLEAGDYTGKTFTGSKNADSIANDAENIILNTGAGDDIIENSSAKVTIDGGKGSNIIHLSADTDTSSVELDDILIKAGAGANSIVLGDKTRKLTVANFGKNDAILLNQKLDVEDLQSTFNIVEGNLVAGNVTVGGLGDFVEGGAFSAADDGKIVYTVDGTDSIVIAQTIFNSLGDEVTSIVYRKEGTELDTKFILTGLLKDNPQTALTVQTVSDSTTEDTTGTVHNGLIISDTQGNYYAFATSKDDDNAVPSLVKLKAETKTETVDEKTVTTTNYNFDEGYSALKETNDDEEDESALEATDLITATKDNTTGAVTVTLSQTVTDLLNKTDGTQVSVAKADDTDTTAYYLTAENLANTKVTWKKDSAEENTDDPETWIGEVSKVKSEGWVALPETSSITYFKNNTLYMQFKLTGKFADDAFTTETGSEEAPAIQVIGTNVVIRKALFAEVTDGETVANITLDPRSANKVSSKDTTEATFVLASDAKPVYTGENWGESISSGSIDYMSDSNTDGYKLEGNTISYVAANETSTLFTLSGLTENVVLTATANESDGDDENEETDPTDTTEEGDDTPTEILFGDNVKAVKNADGSYTVSVNSKILQDKLDSIAKNSNGEDVENAVSAITVTVSEAEAGEDEDDEDTKKISVSLAFETDNDTKALSKKPTVLDGKNASLTTTTTDGSTSSTYKSAAYDAYYELDEKDPTTITVHTKTSQKDFTITGLKEGSNNANKIAFTTVSDDESSDMDARSHYLFTFDSDILGGKDITVTETTSGVEENDTLSSVGAINVVDADKATFTFGTDEIDRTGKVDTTKKTFTYTAPGYKAGYIPVSEITDEDGANDELHTYGESTVIIYANQRHGETFTIEGLSDAALSALSNVQYDKLNELTDGYALIKGITVTDGDGAPTITLSKDVLAGTDIVLKNTNFTSFFEEYTPAEATPDEEDEEGAATTTEKAYNAFTVAFDEDTAKLVVDIFKKDAGSDGDEDEDAEQDEGTALTKDSYKEALDAAVQEDTNIYASAEVERRGDFHKITSSYNNDFYAATAEYDSENKDSKDLIDAGYMSGEAGTVTYKHYGEGNLFAKTEFRITGLKEDFSDDDIKEVWPSAEAESEPENTSENENNPDGEEAATPGIVINYEDKTITINESALPEEAADRTNIAVSGLTVNGTAVSDDNGKFSLEFADGLTSDDIEFDFGEESTDKPGSYCIQLKGTTAGYKRNEETGVYEYREQSGGYMFYVDGLRTGLAENTATSKLTEDMFSFDESGVITFKPSADVLPENSTLEAGTSKVNISYVGQIISVTETEGTNGTKTKAYDLDTQVQDTTNTSAETVKFVFDTTNLEGNLELTRAHWAKSTDKETEAGSLIYYTDATAAGWSTVEIAAAGDGDDEVTEDEDDETPATRTVVATLAYIGETGGEQLIKLTGLTDDAKADVLNASYIPVPVNNSDEECDIYVPVTDNNDVTHFYKKSDTTYDYESGAFTVTDKNAAVEYYPGGNSASNVVGFRTENKQFYIGSEWSEDSAIAVIENGDKVLAFNSTKKAYEEAAVYEYDEDKAAYYATTDTNKTKAYYQVETGDTESGYFTYDDETGLYKEAGGDSAQYVNLDEYEGKIFYQLGGKYYASDDVDPDTYEPESGAVAATAIGTSTSVYAYDEAEAGYVLQGENSNDTVYLRIDDSKVYVGIEEEVTTKNASGEDETSTVTSYYKLSDVVKDGSTYKTMYTTAEAADEKIFTQNRGYLILDDEGTYSYAYAVINKKEDDNDPVPTFTALEDDAIVKISTTTGTGTNAKTTTAYYSGSAVNNTGSTLEGAAALTTVGEGDLVIVNGVDYHKASDIIDNNSGSALNILDDKALVQIITTTGTGSSAKTTTEYFLASNVKAGEKKSGATAVTLLDDNAIVLTEGDVYYLASNVYNGTPSGTNSTLGVMNTTYDLVKVSTTTTVDGEEATTTDYYKYSDFNQTSGTGTNAVKVFDDNALVFINGAYYEVNDIVDGGLTENAEAESITNYRVNLAANFFDTATMHEGEGGTPVTFTQGKITDTLSIYYDEAGETGIVIGFDTLTPTTEAGEVGESLTDITETGATIGTYKYVSAHTPAYFKESTEDGENATVHTYLFEHAVGEYGFTISGLPLSIESGEAGNYFEFGIVETATEDGEDGEPVVEPDNETEGGEPTGEPTGEPGTEEENTVTTPTAYEITLTKEALGGDDSLDAYMNGEAGFAGITINNFDFDGSESLSSDTNKKDITVKVVLPDDVVQSAYSVETGANFEAGENGINEEAGTATYTYTSTEYKGYFSVTGNEEGDAYQISATSIRGGENLFTISNLKYESGGLSLSSVEIGEDGAFEEDSLGNLFIDEKNKIVWLYADALAKEDITLALDNNIEAATHNYTLKIFDAAAYEERFPTPTEEPADNTETTPVENPNGDNPVSNSEDEDDEGEDGEGEDGEDEEETDPYGEYGSKIVNKGGTSEAAAVYSIVDGKLTFTPSYTPDYYEVESGDKSIKFHEHDRTPDTLEIDGLNTSLFAALDDSSSVTSKTNTDGSVTFTIKGKLQTGTETGEDGEGGTTTTTLYGAAQNLLAITYATVADDPTTTDVDESAVKYTVETLSEAALDISGGRSEIGISAAVTADAVYGNGEAGVSLSATSLNAAVNDEAGEKFATNIVDFKGGDYTVQYGGTYGSYEVGDDGKITWTKQIHGEEFALQGLKNGLQLAYADVSVSATVNGQETVTVENRAVGLQSGTGKNASIAVYFGDYYAYKEALEEGGTSTITEFADEAGNIYITSGALKNNMANGATVTFTALDTSDLDNESDNTPVQFSLATNNLFVNAAPEGGISFEETAVNTVTTIEAEDEDGEDTIVTTSDYTFMTEHTPAYFIVEAAETGGTEEGEEGEEEGTPVVDGGDAADESGDTVTTYTYHQATGYQTFKITNLESGLEAGQIKVGDAEVSDAVIAISLPTAEVKDEDGNVTTEAKAGTVSLTADALPTGLDSTVKIAIADAQSIPDGATSGGKVNFYFTFKTGNNGINVNANKVATEDGESLTAKFSEVGEVGEEDEENETGGLIYTAPTYEEYFLRGYDANKNITDLTYNPSRGGNKFTIIGLDEETLLEMNEEVDSKGLINGLDDYLEIGEADANGNVTVTVHEDALGDLETGSFIRLTDDPGDTVTYKLAFDSDIATAKDKGAGAVYAFDTVHPGTVVYTATIKTHEYFESVKSGDYYEAGSDTFLYHPQEGGEQLKIEGLTTTQTLSAANLANAVKVDASNKKTITLNSNILMPLASIPADGLTISVSSTDPTNADWVKYANEYDLKLATDATTKAMISTETYGSLTGGKNGVYSFTASGNTAGYIEDPDITETGTDDEGNETTETVKVHTISYKAQEGQTTFNISGLKTGLTVNGSASKGIDDAIQAKGITLVSAADDDDDDNDNLNGGDVTNGETTKKAVTVTVGKSALSTLNVSLTDTNTEDGVDYTLALATEGKDSVATTKDAATDAGKFTKAGATATYTTTKINTYYEAGEEDEAGTYFYHAEDKTTGQNFTISGLKSTTTTLGASTDDDDDDVVQDNDNETETPNLNLNDTSVIEVTETANDETGKTDITVKFKSNEIFDGKNVALGTLNKTFTGSYNVVFDLTEEGVVTTEDEVGKDGAWSSVTGNKAIYSAGGHDSYYSFNEEENATLITFNKETNNTSKFELSGLKASLTAAEVGAGVEVGDDGIVTIKSADIVGENGATIAGNDGGYIVKLEAGIKLTGTSKVDSIIASTGTVNAGAGKDLITVSGGAVVDAGADDDSIEVGTGGGTILWSAGNDTVNYTSDLHISVGSGYSYSFKNLADGAINEETGAIEAGKGDLLLTSSKGTLLITGGAGREISVTGTGTEEKVAFDKALGDMLTFSKDNKAVTVNGSADAKGSKMAFYGSAVGPDQFAINNADTLVVTINASHYDSSEVGLTIKGTTQNNVIIGTNYGDTIDPGVSTSKSQNTVTGGKGNDVFIYNDGKLVVTDFKSNAAKEDGEGNVTLAADIDAIYLGEYGKITTTETTDGEGKTTKTTSTVQTQNEITSTTISGNNIIFGLNEDKNQTITLSNVFSKSNTVVSVAITEAGQNSNDVTTLSNNAYYSDGHIVSEDGKEVTLLSTYKPSNAKVGFEADKDVTLISALNTTAAIINASLTTAGVEINATAAANTIIGGAGADTITGADKKNDLFVLNIAGGKDTITNFEKADKVSLVATEAGATDDAPSYLKAASISDIVGISATASTAAKTDDDGNITQQAEAGAIQLTFSGTDQYVSIKGADSVNALNINGTNYFVGENMLLDKLASVASGVTLTGAATAFNSTVETGTGDDAKLVYSKNLKTIDASAVTATSGYSLIGNSAANSIVAGKGGKVSIEANGGADTIVGGSATDAYIFSAAKSSDKLTIRNYEAGALIKIVSGDSDNITVDTAPATIDNKTGNVTFTVYSKEDKDNNKKSAVIGSVVVEGAATAKDTDGKVGTAISLQVGENAATNYTYSTLGTINDKAITLGSAITDAKVTALLTADSCTTVDATNATKVTKLNASAITSAVKLVGNSGKNTLTGGADADYLDGGAGDDYIYGGSSTGTDGDTLTGGAGNDTFVYNGGTVYITDYASSDKISMVATTQSAFSSAEFGTGEDKTITLNYGAGNKLIFTNDVNDMGITFIDGKTPKTNVYSSTGTFDKTPSLATALTLAAETTTNFDANVKESDDEKAKAKYPKLATIDSSLVGKKISVTGNANVASYITNLNNNTKETGFTLVGGTKVDTLIGGESGGDVLYGGKSNDLISLAGDSNTVILDADSGNDTIRGFNATDLISLEDGFTFEDATLKSNNLTLKFVGTNSAKKPVTLTTALTGVTLDNTNKATVNIEVGEEDSVAYAIGTDGVITTGTEVKLTSAYTAKAYPSTGTDDTVTAIDAVANTKGISIAGGESATVIRGGSGKDYLSITEDGSLFGGKGDDTLVLSEEGGTLSGEDGADLFVYNGGEVTIADYGVGSDKISLKPADDKADPKVDGIKITALSGVTVTPDDEPDTKTPNSGTIDLEFGTDNTLSVHVTNKSAAVAFVEGKNTKSYTFVDGGYADGKSLTLVSAEDDPVDLSKDSLSGYTTVTANVAATIKGQSTKANNIVITESGSVLGGDAADILTATNGGSLKGGKGNDTFIVGGGSVVIEDYSATNNPEKGSLGADKISISADLGTFDASESGLTSADKKDVVLAYTTNPTTGTGTTTKITVKGGIEQDIKLTEGKSAATRYFTALGTYNDKRTAVTLASDATADVVKTGIANNAKLATINSADVTTAISIGANNIASFLDNNNNKEAGFTLVGGNGNDTIIGGKKDSLVGGKGNDTFVVAGGSNSIQVGDGGNDVIQGFESGDVLTLADPEDATIKITDAVFNPKASNQILSYKDGKWTTSKQSGINLTLTLSSVTSAKTVSAGTVALQSIDAAKGEFELEVGAEKFTYGTVGTIAQNDAITLTSAYKSKKTYNDLTDSTKVHKTIDASAATNVLTIVGGESNGGSSSEVNIVGNKGANVISLNASQTATFEGGAGNDTFIYQGGSLSIADYGVGSDKISLSGENITMSKLSGVTVTADSGENAKGGLLELEFESGNTLKAHVENRSAAVTFAEVDSKTKKTATTNYTFKENNVIAIGKSATVLATQEAYTFSDNAYATITGAASATLDGSENNSTTLKLIGAENTSLVGGKKNDTLIAATGVSGTLNGGDGNDVFIYNGGEVGIEKYAAGEKISVGASVGAITNVTKSKNSFTLYFDTVNAEVGEVDASNFKNTLTVSGDSIDGTTKFAITTTTWNGKKDVATNSTMFFKDGLIFDNGTDANATKVTILSGGDNAGDPDADFNSSDYAKMATITAQKAVETLSGNDKVNTIILEKGSSSSVLGGIGNDTFIVGAGSSATIADFGIGTTNIANAQGTGTVKAATSSIVKGSTFDAADPTTYAEGTDVLKIGGLNGDTVATSISSLKYTMDDDSFSVTLSASHGDDESTIELDNIARTMKTSVNSSKETTVVATNSDINDIKKLSGKIQVWNGKKYVNFTYNANTWTTDNADLPTANLLKSSNVETESSGNNLSSIIQPTAPVTTNTTKSSSSSTNSVTDMTFGSDDNSTNYGGSNGTIFKTSSK